MKFIHENSLIQKEIEKMNIIDGRAHAQAIYHDLAQQVQQLKRQPKLVIIQVANHQASEAYIRGKIKAAEAVGISAEVQNFPETMEQHQLLTVIAQLNEDRTVDGIIVQLPLPGHLDEFIVARAIKRSKDVDGFHPENLGELLIHETLLEPCTPKGIMTLLEREGIELTGKHVCIIGRSNIVGKPIALLALQANATVTICHSRTNNLHQHTQQADIVIVAVGIANFLTDDMIRTGAIVIDVGINRLNGKLVGDVDYDSVSQKASALTPVPGGVGPMTVAMLMSNTVVAATNQQ